MREGTYHLFRPERRDIGGSRLYPFPYPGVVTGTRLAYPSLRSSPAAVARLRGAPFHATPEGRRRRL